MSAGSSETLRLETFADAVFAIAITLLIIEIRLPPHDELQEAGGLGAALVHLWPSYVGYVISFIVIGIMWANDHSLMNLVDRVDHGFITLTLMLLLCIAFLPFPTAVTLLAFVHVALSLSIVVGLAVLYMLPKAGAHAAVADRS
jgi:uncharacterized membrane protein